MIRQGSERGWAPAIAAFAVALLAALVAYRETIASLVHIWSNSDTFAYGFLVAPTCVYLAWRSRDALAPLRPRPYPLALIALIPLGLAWLVGRAASTLLIEQYAFVAMIPVLAFAFFGPRATRRLAFPLAFLFFAVPVGDFFLPRLMSITAEFAEWALRTSGLTIYREGLYIVTTNSRWHVVESCSGLRFTIAGAVLATLFAHLSYRSNLKRAAFIVSAIAVSILANGIRAYVLIMIGHLTQMRRGQGIDHYFYGWLVFTVLMTAWFLVGAAFRDREAPEAPANRSDAESGPSGAVSRGRWIAVAGLAVVALAAWPAFDGFASSLGRDARVAAIAAPSPQGAWSGEAEAGSVWRPRFHGAATETEHRYSGPEGSVRCYIAYYANQTQGRELLHERNSVVDGDDPRWRVVHQGSRRVEGSGPGFEARETVMRLPGEHLVVWHWYWVPDEYTSNPFRAKLLQARARILGRRDAAAVVVLAASASEPRDAERMLEKFSGDMLPSIRRSLQAVYDAP